MNLKIPEAPVRGRALQALGAIAETKLGALALKKVFAMQLGIAELAALGEASRGSLPNDASPLQGRPPRQGDEERLMVPEPGASWPRTARRLVAQFASGELTPRGVAEGALRNAREVARALGAAPVCDYDDTRALAAADAASERYARGAPLGPLDGVPVVVKEQTAVAGLPRQAGTRLWPARSLEDATLVARLRAQGMVVLGTSVMTEYGMSPLGLHALRPMPANPHRAGHVAGGSSTGSAVAVAAGICPLALGNDGGGSIRIPAGLCGVFGIKATFGRLSRAGDAYGGTMATMGPIGASTLDLAQFLDLCAGADVLDSATAYAPLAQPSFARATRRDVRGLEIGVVEEAFASADPRVAEACRGALRVLESAGVKLRAVSIGLAKQAAAIGYVTLGLEALTGLLDARQNQPEALGRDLAITMASLACFEATDYLDAQRLRSTLRRQVREVFGSVDLLALPTTAITAPRFSAADVGGTLDSATIDRLCRMTMLANLTGLPAASAPVGRDLQGLPIGLQLVGAAGDAASVLAALAHLERDGAAVSSRPLTASEL